MKYLIVALGLCLFVANVHGTPCPCQKILQKVCGVNGVTYDNPCELECAGVELLHEGPCGEETTAQQFGVEHFTDKYLPPPAK